MRLSTITSLLVASAAAASAQTNDTCADGLYIIVARGTNEAPGVGLMGTVADDAADRIKGSEVVALDYPATLSDPSYFDSVTNGSFAVRDAVLAYHESCPDGKMAVLGYSQGAQVSMNALCGGEDEEDDEETVEPISRDIIDSSVIAMVMFGDPSFNPNATYDKGTGQNDGIFVRENITACEDLEPRLLSYCDTGDVYCDRGDDRPVHGGYFSKYGDEVVDFIVSRWNSTSSSSPTPTASVSSSTSPSVASSTSEGQPTETADGDSAAMDVRAGYAYLLPLAFYALVQFAL